MEDKISRYQNGDEQAKELLLDEIIELHNHQITKTEATILLHKKYGIHSTF